jgi:outer membrane protein OmpA-like peptidoglycan-associated protein
MKTQLMTVSALALAMAGTGCATKKFVTQTVAPVEARVTGTEGKNVEQDQALAAQSKINQDQTSQLDTLSSDLSRTNERVGDADSKAVAAGQAAQRAGERADAAQRSADGARTLAQQGLDRADQVQTTMERKLDAVNRYQLVMSETVLFTVNQYALDDTAKAKLNDIATRSQAHARYLVEIQGFTDKTGSAEGNEVLSERRADSVMRYLVNQHKIPLRNINSIGSGYALPVADDSTRDGRKLNRRVEIRLYVPEMASASQTVASN